MYMFAGLEVLNAHIESQQFILKHIDAFCVAFPNAFRDVVTDFENINNIVEDGKRKRDDIPLYPCPANQQLLTEQQKRDRVMVFSCILLLTNARSLSATRTNATH